MTVPDYGPEASTRAEAESILNEAGAARWQGLRVPPHGAPPDDIHLAITEIRGRLDTLERLRVRLIGLKGGGRTAAREARADQKEKWDERVRGDKQTGMGLGGEYTPKEQKIANWNLATLPQERHARMVARVADLIATTDEQVATMYFGLRDTQRELLTRVRVLEFESYLERT